MYFDSIGSLIMKLYASYLSKSKLIILTVFVISCKIMFVDVFYKSMLDEIHL